MRVVDADGGGMLASSMQVVEGSTMDWLDAMPEAGAGGAGG